jgi:putative transport protein
LKLPEIVYMLGFATFVYTIGLASGPAFVASLRWREVLCAFGGK